MPRRRIQTQAADDQHARPLRLAATGNRAQACEELGEGKRLHEVVVGACVEPRDAILHRVARGEDQHRRPDPRSPQAPARLEPIDPRQHHVEHNRVVVVRGGHPQRVLAVCDQIDREPLLDEAAAKKPCEPEIILDDQEAHAGILPPRDERQMTTGPSWPVHLRVLASSWLPD